MLIDKNSQRFNLPDSLIVPIAARDIPSINKFIGNTIDQIVGRNGRINALLIKPHNWPIIKESNVSLWSHNNCDEFERRLHPEMQVWVHVDYSEYRKAYFKLGMPNIPDNYVLDHIQNREAIRLRDYSHPYLRLCPVSYRVNTNGGTNSGGEGMEKEFLRSLPSQPKAVRESVYEAIACDIIYADPMDLTKMLDILPGTQVLAGVGKMLKLFYPEE